VNQNEAISVVAGSFAGLTAVVITYPLDLVRAQLAMQDHGGPRKYRGVTDALVRIPQQNGVAALYRGMAPSLLGVAPYSGIKFGVYEAIKRFMSARWSTTQDELPMYARMAAGGFAGLTAQTITYPVSVTMSLLSRVGSLHTRWTC
jgi:solute carrier family 25 protein 42